jgi:hypothetical protein
MRKQISVIVCICRAPKSLIPYMAVITLQDSTSVRNQLKRRGIWRGMNLIMKSNARPDINAVIFLYYVPTVFLLRFAGLRALDIFL